MSKLIMFPGQGLQSPGMAKSLLDLFPRTSAIFEEASDAISLDLRKLCTEALDDELQLTANTQPALVTMSYAMWSVLVSETGLQAALFAGHSLGEYSAAVCSRKLSFSRAVALVRQRGQAMQAAVPVGLGAMAAVLNLEAKTLEELCQSASRPDSQVQPANYNSPQQIVVAGHKIAVDRLLEMLAEKNVKAVPLNVSAPFHSKLMKPAREQMEPLLRETPIVSNDHRIIANVDAQAVDAYSAEYLIKQIDHPVMWMQSMKAAEDLGIETAIEVGPGKVLTGLAKRCFVKKEIRILASADLPALISQLNLSSHT